MILLNFKAYPHGLGEKGEKLLDVIKEVIDENPSLKDVIYVSPSMVDLAVFKQKYPEINFVSEHVDAKEAGSETGWIPVDAIKAYGVDMTLMNHSEHRLDFDKLPEYIKFVQDKGVKVIVCCEDEVEAEKLMASDPYGIAFEPKDLIGTGKSVSTYRPDSVKKFIEVMKQSDALALIGAGVSSGEDVKAGLELEAEGFLLASAFVKSETPKEKLMELCKPYLE